MLEVHLGSRPGRPTLLLALSAGALLATLALAWWQGRQRRALGREVRIDDTPLVVRPPKGWVQHPRDPGTFTLPRDERRFGRRLVALGRRLTFRYQRLATFVPPQKILRVLDLRGWAARSSAPQPARVGPLPGIQVQRVVRKQVFGRWYVQQQVMRLACSARGDVVLVEYVPLTGLTAAQLDLLDRVCAAIRLDIPALVTTAPELLGRAGLDFPLSAGWSVCGPDFPQVPGCYVLGVAEGMPAWALGVFRTWLAAGRTVADLLVSFAGERWLLAAEDARVATSRRRDGARVATLRHPAFGAADHNVASAWAVARSAEQAALVFVFAGQRSAQPADRAAGELVGALRFTRTDALPSLAAAQAAGQELAALLTQKGGVPWWGRLPLEAYYLSSPSSPLRSVYVGRAAIGDDPAAGYRGHTLYLCDDQAESRLELWTTDGQARGYAYSFQGRLETWRGAEPVTVEERLAPGAAVISRTLRISGRQRSCKLSVGPAFVRPPMESVAEAWVAARSQGAWLIQATTHFDVQPHTRLLRPLAADAAGHRRVLLLLDFWPRGIVLGFDEQGEPFYESFPGGQYRRSSAEATEAGFPALRRWRSELEARLFEPAG